MKRNWFFLLLLVFWGLSDIAQATGACYLFYTQTVANDSYALKFLKASAQKISPRDTGMNRQKLIEAVRRDPYYQWITEPLLQNQLNFSMNRKETSRDGIAELGFQNMFESGRTGTGISIKERTSLEAAMSGMSVKEYNENVPFSERPLYAYLSPADGSSLKRESVAMAYGLDTYTFKTEKLAPVATWTIGDSLDRDLEVNMNGKYLKVPRMTRFLPWSDRDLMLPRLRQLELEYPPEELALQDLDYWIKLPNGKTFAYYPVGVHQNYIEVQFWRRPGQKITLDDVAKFSFRGTPPAGKFLYELRRRGIEIYYNSSGPYDSNGKDVLWTEDQK